MKIRGFVKCLLLVVLVVLAWFGSVVQSAAEQPQAQQAPDSKAQTVYITRTGKKYHRAGCSSHRSSSVPISLKDAKAKGYGACKLCHPPE